MNLNELPLDHSLLTDRNIAIKLVGVGGAGSNAVDRLKMENLERLQLAVINTDYQALASSPVQDKVLVEHGAGRLLLRAVKFAPGAVLPAHAHPYMQASMIVEGGAVIGGERFGVWDYF